MNVVPQYKLRWLTKEQGYEIVNLYHLSRTALAGVRWTPYDGKLWAAREMHRKYPDISEGAAYKDLDGLLS